MLVLHLLVDTGRNAEDDHEHRRQQSDHHQNGADHDHRRDHTLDEIHLTFTHRYDGTSAASIEWSAAYHPAPVLPATEGSPSRLSRS